MNAYQLKGDEKYLDIVKLAWDFIDRRVIDHGGGEWFTKVNRLGVPYLIEPDDDPSPYYRNYWKIDPWKCPYHNGRAMMEMAERIESNYRWVRLLHRTFARRSERTEQATMQMVQLVW